MTAEWPARVPMPPRPRPSLHLTARACSPSATPPLQGSTRRGSSWQRPSAELTPGPELYNDRFGVRDWGCADFSKALGKPARTRAYEICGRAWRVFSDNGGAPVLGRPLAAPDARSSAPSQWLEKVRLEQHPEEDRPFDLTPGRLGLERLMQLGIDWRTSALAPFQEEAAQKPGCLLLSRPATDGGRGIRHNVCDSAATPAGSETATGFLAFWKQLPDGLAAPRFRRCCTLSSACATSWRSSTA